MQIVIPMAGISSRFTKAGHKIPKYLLEVDGKLMIEHIVNMFPGEEDFLFICNKDHFEKYNLKRLLKKIKPSSKIVSVDGGGQGPVYNTLLVKKYIKDQEPVLVSYCDFSVHWDYQDFKNKVLKSKADGSVICYKGFHPHLLGPNLYAGVLAKNNNSITDIKEKHSFTENKMDTWQSAGSYYFRSGQLLKKYFQQLVEENINVNGEFYVSLVYQLLLRDQKKVSLYPVKYFCQWGTPEDLKEYQYWSEYFSLTKKRT